MHRRLAATIALLAAGSLLAPGGALAQTDAEVERAVQRGLTWVQGRQDAAGFFRDHWHGQGYTSGETALALLTLLKAGVPPGDPRIERGFEWLLQQPLRRIYEVSVTLLALEARYTPDPKRSLDSKDALQTQIRKRFQKVAPPRDRRFIAEAVAYLTRHQEADGLWRYPGYGDADLSNAQFALLALKAAERLSVRCAPQVYLKTALKLVECQEREGASIESFPVPAADGPIKGLLDKRDAKAKEPKEGGATGPRLTSQARTPMRARGWGYRPKDSPRGSMTAAGLAMLVICKSELEGFAAYKGKLPERIDQALRDGAAWLATRFAADRNPGADPDWLFYYLYTLERAGTLLALDGFGPHDWYREGARVILARQQGDGSFDAKTKGQADGGLAGTCLALLFLKRSTVPVLKRERALTGGPAPGAPDAKGPSVRRLEDGRLEVTFRFKAEGAQRVTVAGSFNGWDKDKDALVHKGGGLHEVTLTLPAGKHGYKFVVDGQHWRSDPDNPKGEPDGHGGQNSLVE